MAKVASLGQGDHLSAATYGARTERSPVTRSWALVAERVKSRSRLKTGRATHVPIRNSVSSPVYRVFPALWILAVVLDRFLPSNSSLYSPQDERKRQSERDELYTARPEKSPSGRQSSQQTPTKQGEKERVATLPRSKSEEAYRARAAAALVAAVRPTAPSLDGNRPMHPLRFPRAPSRPRHRGPLQSIATRPTHRV